MELQDYARHVLFGTRLEDKLVDPGRLSDRSPGPALAGRPEPGRPPGLRFEDRGDRSRTRRPGPRALEDPLRAGRLLHAFANHELLAAELMALVLLRFPEAPGPFRRALAQTLREEQLHLRLYIERMGEFGVEFGEIPVNAFFWDCVADVEDPLDFVVRMGLVFEQANLDFTRLFAARFREVGDERTAAILDKVHADELGHVKHGLHWFRAWKEPELSEWEAFSERLELPLDPSRARAPGYDREGRLALGFTPEFLDQLEVWGRSKGRPPVVWCFDPTAELQVSGHPAALGQGPLKGQLGALRRDLSGLMGVLAATGDAVLVSQRPTAAFLRPWREAGLPEVEWIASGDPPGSELSGLDGRHLARLEPWALSPATLARLQPLAARAATSLSGDDGTGPSRRWWSKETALGEARALLTEDGCLGPPEWLARPEVLGEVVPSAEAALDQARRLLEAHEEVVLKGLVATAGRGNRRLRRGEAVGTPLRGWLDARCEADGGVLVGPWLPRVLDLSFHLDLDEELPEGARYRDWCRFRVDRRGQFTGAVLGRRLDGLDKAVLRFFFGDGRERRWIHGVGEALARALGPRLLADGLRGPVGIDAFIYRDRAGGLRLHPLVELNPRWTMGRVALALEARVASGQAGLWTLLGGPGAPARATALVAASPPVCRQRHLAGGALATTDPATAEAVGSVLLVGDSLAECEGMLAGG